MSKTNISMDRRNKKCSECGCILEIEKSEIEKSMKTKHRKH